MPKLVLLCYLSICLSSGVALFAQSRPTTLPSGAQELSAIPYGGLRLLSVQVSRDGSRALLNLDQPAAQRDVVAVYDVATGKQLLKRDSLRPKTISFLGDAISPDGAHVALSVTDAKANSTVSIIQVDRQETLWEAPTGPGDVEFFPDGGAALLMYIPPDAPPKTRRLIAADIATGKPLWQFDPQDVGLGLLRFSPDGKGLLGYVQAKGAPQCVLDLTTRKRLPELHDSTIGRLSDASSFLGDSRTVVGLVAGRLKKWDATSGKVVEVIEDIDRLDRDAYATFSPDGRHLCLLIAGELILRNAKTGRLMHKMPVLPGAELKAVSNNGIIALRVFASLRFIRLPVDPPAQ